MKTLLEHYTYFHAHPELSGREKETARYLKGALTEAGYQPVSIGEHGVYADLLADPALPWLLLRADMDALPVTEETGCAWASQTPGVMHACGHDAHMAMLLAAAQALQGEKLPQNVRFLFQPAEETVVGAREMIDCGAVPSNCVAVLGMHLWPGIPVGKVLARSGALMASVTNIQIRCKGLAAHCGKREQGRDAMMTMAELLVRTREIEALEGGGSLLFFGRLQAGASQNVVASQATMEGTLRTFDPGARERTVERLEKIAAETAERYGTSIALSYSGDAPAVINPEELIRKIQKCLPNTVTEAEPTRIAEDFASYQQVAPGALLWLGVGQTAGLHNGSFLPPQEVLPVGADTWMRLVRYQW